MQRTFLQKLFGLGSICCHTKGSNKDHVVIKNIHDSKRVRDLLTAQVDKSRLENHVYIYENGAVGNQPPHGNHKPGEGHSDHPERMVPPEPHAH